MTTIFVFINESSGKEVELEWLDCERCMRETEIKNERGREQLVWYEPLFHDSEELHRRFLDKGFRFIRVAEVTLQGSLIEQKCVYPKGYKSRPASSGFDVYRFHRIIALEEELEEGEE